MRTDAVSYMFFLYSWVGPRKILFSDCCCLHWQIEDIRSSKLLDLFNVESVDEILKDVTIFKRFKEL
jgi:hypothetical protein